jgi:hypothetical protein
MLNEQNRMWVQYRHLQVDQVLRAINFHVERLEQLGLDKIREENKHNFQLRQLQEALPDVERHLKDGHELSAQIELFSRALKRVGNDFEMWGQFVGLEQSIVTGVQCPNGDSKNLSSAAAVKELMKLLIETWQSVSLQQRRQAAEPELAVQMFEGTVVASGIRLVLLLVLSFGLNGVGVKGLLDLVVKGHLGLFPASDEVDAAVTGSRDKDAMVGPTTTPDPADKLSGRNDSDVLGLSSASVSGDNPSHEIVRPEGARKILLACTGLLEIQNQARNEGGYNLCRNGRVDRQETKHRPVLECQTPWDRLNRYKGIFTQVMVLQENSELRVEKQRWKHAKGDTPVSGGWACACGKPLLYNVKKSSHPNFTFPYRGDEPPAVHPSAYPTKMATMQSDPHHAKMNEAVEETSFRFNRDSVNAASPQANSVNAASPQANSVNAASPRAEMKLWAEKDRAPTSGEKGNNICESLVEHAHRSTRGVLHAQRLNMAMCIDNCMGTKEDLDDCTGSKGDPGVRDSQRCFCQHNNALMGCSCKADCACHLRLTDNSRLSFEIDDKHSELHKSVFGGRSNSVTTPLVLILSDFVFFTVLFDSSSH